MFWVTDGEQPLKILPAPIGDETGLLCFLLAIHQLF